MATYNDIYGKTITLKNTTFVTSETMILRVGDGSGSDEEFLIQNVAIQYNQALNRVYEIGTCNTYFAPGRTMGTLQIGRIIGKKLITDVLGATGQGVWNANDDDMKKRTLRFYNSDPDSKNKPVFTVTGAVVESYSVQTNAQGLLLYENVSISFASLTMEDIGTSSNNSSRNSSSSSTKSSEGIPINYINPPREYYPVT